MDHFLETLRPVWNLSLYETQKFLFVTKYLFHYHKGNVIVHIFRSPHPDSKQPHNSCVVIVLRWFGQIQV